MRVRMIRGRSVMVVKCDRCGAETKVVLRKKGSKKKGGTPALVRDTKGTWLELCSECKKNVDREVDKLAHGIMYYKGR